MGDANRPASAFAFGATEPAVATAAKEHFTFGATAPPVTTATLKFDFSDYNGTPTTPSESTSSTSASGSSKRGVVDEESEAELCTSNKRVRRF
jgi:hypothetical protein